MKIKTNTIWLILSIISILIYITMLLLLVENEKIFKISEPPSTLAIPLFISNILLLQSLSLRKRILKTLEFIYLSSFFLTILLLPLFSNCNRISKLAFYNASFFVFAIALYFLFSYVSQRKFGKSVDIMANIDLVFLSDGSRTYLDLLFTIVYLIYLICYWVKIFPILLH
jgi:hypothetical protein